MTATTGTRATLSDRASAAMEAVLDDRPGRPRPGRLRAATLFAGPAVVASIAYVDPGNFATNIQAGSRYGYALLWVVVLANAVAMLFQALSAKLGIATGRNLAETCRDRLPPALVLPMWLVSELAAMATDLAEFLGGAIGLSILLHLPLLPGMVVTAALTAALLTLQRRGFRPMELLIGALVGVIGLCYLLELLVAPVDWRRTALHAVLPTLPDAGALEVAVGIVGATVMPHAIYLHSSLTQHRVPAGGPADRSGRRRRLVRFSNREVAVALTLAGAVNMAMVMMAASAFHRFHPGVAEIGDAYRTLQPLLGAGAAGAFLLSLMASGVSSSVVGTMAGQMIMQGFTGRRLPLWLRRLVTMLPAFAVVGAGMDATRALVLSQVALSLALPFPLLALVAFTRDRALMGPLRNRLPTHVAALAGTAVILVLNAVLVLQALGVPIPGLPAA